MYIKFKSTGSYVQAIGISILINYFNKWKVEVEFLLTYKLEKELKE